jgi:hypothetical protein
MILADKILDRDYDSVTDALARITRGKCHRGPLANAATRERVQWARGNTGVATRGVATAAGVFLKVATEGRRIKFTRRVAAPQLPRGLSPERFEPVGLRVKSDLRNQCTTNHRAIVRPRSWRSSLQYTCDCSMVTQITLPKKGEG